jgi:drug/metabolite transporter (DMT)-like permease
MYALLAFAAAVLTSLLPILNKRMLRDIHPALVAWAINAASLPILATGTLLLMQCAIIWRPAGVLVSCVANLPHVDFVFGLALLGSAVLNWAATLISMHALAAADASLVSPLLTFNPAFTLLVAWPALGEAPGLRQALGMALVLLGAYLLEVEGARAGILEPLRILLHRPGALLAIIASALWGITTVLEKLATKHVTPPSGPLVALAGTLLTVILLTPGALVQPGRATAVEYPGTPEYGYMLGQKHTLSGLRAYLRTRVSTVFGAGKRTAEAVIQ